MLNPTDMVLRLVQEAKSFSEIEERIAKLIFELGKMMFRAVLTYLDWKLATEREKGLRNLGMREREVITRFGTVRVRRRYYRDREGRTRFLLDEALGWDKGGTAATPSIEARALELSSEISYRGAAKHLSFFLASDISHMTLHRLVQERGGERAEEKASLAEDLFRWGALPPCEGREAERLFLEADGCMIPLQREERRKHEVKVGISYEGWHRVGEDKWRTTARRTCLSAADGASFLREWSAGLASVYDHAKVDEVIWSSDGASWLRKGPDLFACAHAQVDRFHLAKSLTRALGFSCEAFRLFSLAEEGKAAEVIAGLEGHLEKATDKGKRKRIAQAIAYISSLAAWLLDWRDVLPAKGGDRSPGAIESNVDKLAADRFKKRGMSWRPSGADHMCQVIELRGERGAGLLHPQKKEGGRKKGPGGHGLHAQGGEKGPGGLA